MTGLNEMQDIACRHVEGPLLILAGAGSGKTRVITHRVAYLMKHEGINPYHILAITFTNKAAAEMRERVNQIVGQGAERVWVSTFHSLCVRILRRYADRLDYNLNFNIYDSDDQKAVFKAILKDLSIDSKKYPEKMFMAEISKAKEKYISPDEYDRINATDYAKTKVAEVYREYSIRLKKFNAFDFDDLIYKTVELFEHHPDVLEAYQERFRYIMVDEYQDTNHIQFLLVKLLAKKYRNLCVVGDDDQSIYKFRGANITNILNFEQEYPEAKVVKLEQNYRSCATILNAANAVIRHNTGRRDKALWTEQGDGDKITFTESDTEYEEADKVASEIIKLTSGGIPYCDIAILYRTNAQSRVLGEKLVMRNIPYRVYGGTNFYERKEIRDILAYLKVVNNTEDDTYVKRIVNVPKRGIGDTTVNKIEIFAAVNGISLMDAMKKAKEIPGMSSKTAEKVNGFYQLIENYKKMVYEQEPISVLYDRILEDTGYEEQLIAEHTDESMGRLENLDELRNKVVLFEEDNEEATLGEFLEDIALVSDMDNLNADDNVVRLMTLHSAKGLEFPYVFMCGMEERIFPSGMAINSEDEDALEEERRLCYVGITRAMKKLYMSSAHSRMMHGSYNYNEASRFVREIPPMLFSNSGNIDRLNRHYEDYVQKNKEMNNGYSYGKNYGYAGKEYGSNNPYKKKTGTYNSMPQTKPAFGREFVVNMETHIDYQEGDRVRHMKYGTGTVIALVKGGKDYEVTVDFDRCGPRKMFASFAKLKKL